MPLFVISPVGPLFKMDWVHPSYLRDAGRSCMLGILSHHADSNVEGIDRSLS